MLTEYALLPSVLESSSYANDDLCVAYLQLIKNPLLDLAIVRNLQAGGWEEYLRSILDTLHPRSKELLKKLVKARRLRRVPSVSGSLPATSQEWGVEALASHTADPLTGIIACDTAADAMSVPEVSAISKIGGCSWWRQGCANSRCVRRTTADYLERLRFFLECANSLMFIDPFIDPSKAIYREFYQLLARCIRSDGVNPTIEIHRQSFTGSGASRQFPDWEAVFRSSLEKHLPKGLQVDVFIWSEFHDRYLISDLGGISLPNGFDIDLRPTPKTTTWTRLSNNDRDRIQRDHDATARPQKRFTLIGA